MNRFFKCVCFAAVCCLFGSLTESAGIAQVSARNSLDGSRPSFNQDRNAIAALPASSDVASTRVASSWSDSQPVTKTQPHSAFYPQTAARTDVYNYPASSPPRSGMGRQSMFGFRNNATASLTNQMSVGSTTATGNLSPPVWRNNQAPVYNLNQGLYIARSLNETSSRSPVEQQRSSTLSSPQSLAGQTGQFTTAQQAQSQAIELARRAQYQQSLAQQTLAQAQQAQARATQIAQASQPTTVYRQAVFQQPTLGLGAPQFRTTQTCSCVATPNSAVSAFRVPAQNLGLGATVPVAPPGSSPLTPLVNLQNMPAGTYVGQGIIGQPTAYRDGQPIRNLFRYITP